MKNTVTVIWLIFLVSLVYASTEFIEWESGKIKLDEDGHYRGPSVKQYRGEPHKKTVDHSVFGAAKPDCQGCHNKPELGYDYVSSERFIKTRHYRAILDRKLIKGIQDACLICHIDDRDIFIPYPGDNLTIGTPFSIYRIENNNTETCGKCHAEITERNKNHIMSTTKGHYYRSEMFPYQEALGVSAEQVYMKCSVCHTSCASSCHMVGQDGQAVDWTFIQPYLDHKVGPPARKVWFTIAEGEAVEGESIREYLVGTYIKGGGPGYRMLAKMGKAPLETIKLDIASHEFVLPAELSKEVANDICLRCHTCMVNPLDRLNKMLAHQSLKCVDCHREGDVHGHTQNPARFAFEAVDASCTTCHLKENIYQGKAESPTDVRTFPIVNPVFHKSAPEIPEVKGAHQKVSCEICHSLGLKQCNECHLGDLIDRVGDIMELSQKTPFYGRDKNGIVRFMLMHEIFGKDEKKYGGWIVKKTVHNLKRSANADCESCHTDPVRMGLTIPKLRLINTYLLSSAGVPDAYIDKDKHYEKFGISESVRCLDCHTEVDASLTASFHQTIVPKR